LNGKVGTYNENLFFRNETAPREEMVYNIKEKPFKTAIRLGKYKLLWGNLSPKVSSLLLVTRQTIRDGNLKIELN